MSQTSAAAPESPGVGTPGFSRRIEPGQTLLHIGLPKTATTSVQTVAASLRKPLRAHGVLYPGSGHSQSQQWFALNRSHLDSATPEQLASARLSKWGELLKEIRSEPGLRTFLSAEAASQGERTAVERVGRDLGTDTRIVVTMRNIGERLSSDWQQHIRSGEQTRDLESWLRLTFGDTQDPHYASYFAERAIHPATTLRRWADVFGTSNITVVMVDKQRPNLVYEAFEEMLALPPGMLSTRAAEPGIVQPNRGWSLTETELARQVRIALNEVGITVREARFLLNQGGYIRSRLKRAPLPSEGRIQLPAWAAERVNRIAIEQRDLIAGMGLDIIGDLDGLATPVRGVDTLPELPDTVPMDLAVETILGIVSRALELDYDFRPISDRRKQINRDAIASVARRTYPGQPASADAGKRAGGPGGASLVRRVASRLRIRG